MSPDFITTLGFAMGSAWLSGINLYATVVTLGLLQRFHLVQLPGSLDVLQHWWIVGLAGFLYIVEFAADKIPAVDSIWDAVHTFIRIPAGAVMAASAFAHFDPSVRWVALLAGGGVALSSHGTKAATRLAANTSPEPFSNILLSLWGRLDRTELVFTDGVPSDGDPCDSRNFSCVRRLARAAHLTCSARTALINFHFSFRSSSRYSLLFGNSDASQASIRRAVGVSLSRRAATASNRRA